MVEPTLDVVFGSKAAALVLLYLQNYEKAYPREISRTYEGLSLSQVQRQLAKFEESGLLNSRIIGTIRLYEWSRRTSVVGPLRDFLQSMLEMLPPEYVAKHYMQRRRPRRPGKATEFDK